MILGFAHITKNVAYNRGADAVANASAKHPLMAGHATMHWLSLRRQDGLTEEMIEYDTGIVERPSRIELDDARCIWLTARDQKREKRFLCEAFGFQANEESIEIVRLASPVSWWSVTINICQEANAPIDPPLDIAGYAAIAFYSSDVEADRDHLLKHGGRTPTEPFTVKLDREMKIVMLRSPEGTIIELIQVMP
jgi:hypothetical protein